MGTVEFYRSRCEGEVLRLKRYDQMVEGCDSSRRTF